MARDTRNWALPAGQSSLVFFLAIRIAVLIAVLVVFLGQFGKGLQTRLDLAEDTLGRVLAFLVPAAGGNAGQELYTLGDGSDRIDVELGIGHRRDHAVMQHQMHDVRFGNHDALLAGQAAAVADVEKALDLLVHPADRLHLALLVD